MLECVCVPKFKTRSSEESKGIPYMKDEQNSKQRAFSLLKTIGSTAVKAGNEAIKKKLNGIHNDDFSISSAALRLTKGLDELKGAAMKIGQMLSMMDDNLLPKGWKEALSKLQSEATPRDWSYIEPILKEHIGSLDMFSAIEHEAVSAASIAQVHRAYLKDGRTVAIKVQYPGLESNVKSDLLSMKKLIKLANVMPNMANYDHLFTAAEEMFKQELDFEREKNFYNLYYEKFKSHKNVIVPKTINELCSKRVLVTEWIDGVNLQKWLDLNNNSLVKNQIGETLLDVIFTEILLMGYIQSDPNPGNFLVTKENKLVLLDFGATQLLRTELVDNYVGLIQAGLKQNRIEIIRFAKKMGFIESGDSDEVRNSFIKVITLALEPFMTEKYSWLNCDLTKRINVESFTLMKATKFRAPSGDVLFMNRRLAGNLLMMEKLGPECAGRDLFLRLLQEREKQ
jgi:aarF domain-containing kinase